MTCAAVGVLLAASVADAQTGSAMLSGTVTDDSGGIIRGARITIVQADTNARRETATNDEGVFLLPTLAPGRYVLRAEHTGFRAAELKDVVLNVNDRSSVRISLGAAGPDDAVTIVGQPSRVTTSSAVATVIDRQFVENLPLNGRSFQALLALTPGVTLTGGSLPGDGQFSVNGQRPNANYFTVDGVGANVAAGAAYWPDQEAAGVTPALNAVGGTQSLLSVDALEEFSIQTSTYGAQSGRQPGGQVSLVSRAGTNQLHGSLFEYFRDDAMDATNWFVNANRLPEAPLKQHQFGGSLGGPLRVPGYDGRNRTFFFFSYEGLRLTQPRTLSSDVPSMSLREEAFPALKPLLATLPIPTGPENPLTRQAPFVAAYSNKSAFDTTSIRLDQHLSSGMRVFGRFSYSPSRGTTRTLNNIQTDRPELRTTTVGLTQTLGSTLTHDARFNETKNRRWNDAEQDDFGGAAPLPYEALVPPGLSLSTPVRLQIHQLGVASPLFFRGQNQLQRQFNLVDTWTWSKGRHLLKFGGDYRELRPTGQPWEYFAFIRFNTVQSVLTGVPAAQSEALDRVDMRFRSFAAFVDDSWRVSPRLTIDLGLRWDLNPPITQADGTPFRTLMGTEHPETMRLAPEGMPPYPTDYKAFGPRVGASFVTSQRTGWEQTLRGGFGIVSDLGAGTTAQSAIYYPYARIKQFPAGMPYPFDAAAWAPPVRTSANPPYDGQTFLSFPDYATPRTYEWNVSIEQSVGRVQSVTATYVGAAGRHLPRQEWWFAENPSPDFTGRTSIRTNRTNAVADYAALQLQYRRRLSAGLQALASYTLSKSEDTLSSGGGGATPSHLLDPEINRGPSTFDRRHLFSTAVTYALPSPASGAMAAVLRDWSIAAILQAQSALPIDITMSRNIGIASLSPRPDVVPGVPFWLDEPTRPGGRRINPDAFSVPAELRMGNLPRNALRAFPLRQVDLSLSRSVAITSGVRFHLRVDLFNAFNTPNFSNPSGFLGSVNGGVLTPSSTFGVSTSTIDNDLGGLNGVNRLYAPGGPRSIQLSARITL